MFSAVIKVVLTAIVLLSLMTGCVVVERPYHARFDEFHHDYNGRRCD